MAEQLGEAVLRVTVDDSAARESLNRLRQEVSRSTRAAGGGGRTAGGARESVQALERAQSRRFALAQRIERLEERGAEVARLRARLGDLTTAQSQRQFGTARQLSVELDRQVKLANARFRREQDTAAVIAKQARLGGPRESITGRRGLQGSPADLAFLARQGGARSPIGGAVNIPGSPAFLAAQKRAGEIQARAYVTEVSRLARQGGARSPIGGAVDIPGSPAFLAAQRRFAAQDLSRAATIGGPRSPIGGSISIPGSPAFLADQQRQIAQQISRAASIGGPRSPIGGSLNLPGSPAFLAAAEKKLTAERLKTADATLKAATTERKTQEARRKEIGDRVGGALGSALIGGGFPLLFGQGVGAAAGGLAGGALGGAIGGQFGFGLSIVGTIVGDAFDVALEKGKTLAAGLSDPIGKFDELRQAGLISSKALEKNVASLIAQGRNAEAAAQIQADLANSFGDTSQLTALNTAYDELNRAFTQLSVITAKYVAGPLADFLNKLTGAFTAQSTQALLNERLAGAPEAARAQILAARRAAFTEASQAGTPGGAAITAGNLAGLRAANELLGKTKEQQRIEAARALAITRENSLRSVSFRQIDAQVQGYERLNLELEKQRINEQRIQDLSVAGADPDKINREAAQATARVQAQINNLAKDRVAIATEEAAKYQLAGEKLKQELQAVQALAALSQNAQRTAQFAVQQSTLSTIQGIEASVGEARRREREIGAKIDAARLRGGDAGEQEAARLVNEQKLAGQQTRLELEKGSEALTKAGIKLREDAAAAVLNLQKLRTGPEGLNKYLSPQARQRREEQVSRELAPFRRQAEFDFMALTGERAPTFTGSNAAVNKSVIDFIDAVKTEQTAFDTVTDIQEALNLNTIKLANVNAELVTKVGELNAKEWVVQVNANVPFDTQSQLEVNRASSLP